jgi:spermidine synthase
MTIWEKILFRGESPYNGEVKVTEGFGVRKLIASGFTQSQSLNRHGLTGLRYWDSMVPESLSLDRDSRVLVLGLGGGTVPKIITQKFGSIAIDGVEIDPLIVELARKFFNLTEKNVSIFVQDAQDFVNEARYKYDLICLDVFKGGKVPPAMEDLGFLHKVRGLLKETGLLSINKIFSGREELGHFESLVRSVFPKAESFVIKGNIALNNVIIYARI